MTQQMRLGPGAPAPLGATVVGSGVNFALASAHPDRVCLCLFDEHGTETRRIPLPERTGDIWHGHVDGLAAGQRYGYRVEGAYAPARGHRFNAHKLLIDPYARALDGRLTWDDALMGYHVGGAGHDLSYDTADSAPFVPKGLVTAPMAPADEPRPNTPWTDTVIYETHVKGLTMLHPGNRAPGKYRGVTDPALLEHLKRLGVTAIELLPVHAFIEDGYLAGRGMTNYWGYQTLSFFAPARRYAETDAVAEFREMVRTLHDEGFEVILDVVYNHTCEGDWQGPTLSFRGIDNASYYRLAPDGRSYVNDTGTGNTMNTAHPMVQRLVLDSLRYWAGVMGVDGFRFDLGTVIGREEQGFDPGAALLDAIRQDPLLAERKMIFEPWDIGHGGYQLGGFPPPFGEWNDIFRDTVRRFWRGDDGEVRHLAGVVAGSAAQFDNDGRPATSSVNLVTAHDGFTLMDVVSYALRHNEANGENNQDGHPHNSSDNMGHEGPTDDPDITAARLRRRRNMLATLMLSQGTPMLLSGDEFGNSQGGNNNAYVQDNETGWLDWPAADLDLAAFVGELTALRRALARMAGLERDNHVPLDIAPLLETVDDLNAGPAILEELLALDIYREHLAVRGNRQVIMIGYSDSSKDSGIVSSRWSLYEAQRKLIEIGQRHGVRVHFFHGRGGTVSRGGGNLVNGIEGAPPDSIDGCLRVTEQGEVINQKYGVRPIALRNLELMTGAVLRHRFLDTAAGGTPEALALMDEMAGVARGRYRDLVFGDERFVPYFRAATPIDVIERLNIGSRPASRRSGLGVENLRAIPWVFSWAQVRGFCEQIEQQLAELLPPDVTTRIGQRKLRKPSTALIATAGVLALAIVIAMAMRMRPQPPPEPPRVPLPEPVVIPAGTYPTPDGTEKALPAFRISTHEVTIGEYAEFLEILETLANDQRERIFDHESQPAEKTSHLPDGWAALFAAAKARGTWNQRPVTLDCPVVGVDWWDASAFAEWQHARLPTQEEWFAALRFDVAKPAAIKPAGWIPVTSATSDRTPLGLVGMAGSVCEWTREPAPDPANPLGKRMWVIVGGSYLKPGSNALTREWGEARSLRRPDLGFRVVFDAD